MSVAAILTPAISGILSRSEDPTSVIGGYSLSLSIIMLISLPHLRIQQLTIVYYKNLDVLKKMLMQVQVKKNEKNSIHCFLTSLLLFMLVESKLNNES